MFIEVVDFKRSAWDPETLAAIVQHLQDGGYQVLTAEIHQLVGRFTSPQADRSMTRAVAGAEEFTDVLIPPVQPRARVIFHHRQPDVLRVVVAGRAQHETRMVATALKVDLQGVLGARLDDLIADEGDRASLSRFRRDVIPALQLTGDGEQPQEIRNPAAAQLLRAMRHQPAVRGRPTVLGSQLATLAPDRAVHQTRDALEQLVGEGALERWHVVLCRETGQWLATSPSAEEMRTFLSLNMECPHCGRRVSEEQTDVAYRLGERAQAYVSDNRWMVDLVEAELRRLGVEAVAVHPGAGAVDGAACYQGAVILFRAKDDAVDPTDLARLRERGRQLEGEGWRVFPVLVADRPVAAEARAPGVAIVEGVGALDVAFEQILKTAREASLTALLPEKLRFPPVPLADLLPAD